MARKSEPTNSSTRTRQIVNQMETKRTDKKQDKDPNRFIRGPVCTWNLCCTDNPNFLFSKGRMVNLIGDSNTGKTSVSLSIMAENCKFPEFDDYRMIFDDVENALDFDIEYLFGEELMRRMEPPAYDEDGEWLPSDTIEDFHINVLNALEEGTPFIYVLDSFDALDAEQDQSKIEEMREARQRNKKAKGSYAMSKPKIASQILRNICRSLKESNSVLIIISQTRDNINPMSFEKKTRSGGRALKFYAHHEMWMSVGGPTIKSKELVIGSPVELKVTKNKATGKVRTCKFNIYDDYGVDDVRSMIEYMAKIGAWKKTKQTINATHLNMKGTVEKLIREIEDKGIENRLRKIVGREWRKIEEDIRLTHRKRRY